MMAFQALFTDYNKNAIGETHFYTGIVMLLARTQSWHLLPALREVLPPLWRSKNLTWLNQAVEARYENKIAARSTSPDMAERNPSVIIEQTLSDAVESNSSESVERTPSDAVEPVASLARDTPPPIMRKKRRPVNGFRTSGESSNPDTQPLFVDPAALMIHQPEIKAMPDSDDETQTSIIEEYPCRKGLVKLKLKTSKPAAEAAPARQSSQNKASTKASKSKRSFQEMSERDETIDEATATVQAGKRVRSKSTQPLQTQPLQDIFAQRR